MSANPAMPPVLDAPACPLCGQANGCAAVAAGHFAVDCWCRQVPFPADLLARVPAPAQGRACICRACAERHGTPVPSGAQPPLSPEPLP